jgi:hypothetical protein
MFIGARRFPLGYLTQLRSPDIPIPLQTTWLSTNLTENLTTPVNQPCAPVVASLRLPAPHRSPIPHHTLGKSPLPVSYPVHVLPSPPGCRF